MDVKTENGHVLITMALPEGTRLAKAVIGHAEDAHDALLNFAYLLNEAKDNAHNDFRQPPNAWGTDAAAPPPVRTSGNS